MKFLLGSEFSDELISLVDRAVGQIDVAMYQFSPPRKSTKSRMSNFFAALERARARDVKIRVLLHCGRGADPLREINAQTQKWLVSKNILVKFFDKNVTLHAKFLLVDRKFCLSGSHNFSGSAVGGNVELSTLFEGSAEILRVQNYFNLLWSQS